MAWLNAHESILIGLIFMLVLGPAVGNYLCSVVYRLPRGQTPFERHPYCGHCGADLQPRDLFPILSWLSTRGRCRYCGGAIPTLYTVIEIACGALFIINFLTFGISEMFLLATGCGVFVIAMAAVQWQQGWVSASLYVYAFFFAVLTRSMADGTIYPWVQTTFLTLVACLALHRTHAWAWRREPRPFDTPWIWWLVLCAAWLPMPQLTALSIPIALLLVFRFACRSAGPWALFPVAAFTLTLPLLG